MTDPKKYALLVSWDEPEADFTVYGPFPTVADADAYWPHVRDDYLNEGELPEDVIWHALEMTAPTPAPPTRLDVIERAVNPDSPFGEAILIWAESPDEMHNYSDNTLEEFVSVVHHKLTVPAVTDNLPLASTLGEFATWCDAILRNRALTN